MSRVSDYDMIVEVKSAIDEFLEDTEKFRALDEWAKKEGYNLYDVTSFAIRKLSHRNVHAALILRCIVESGSFHYVETSPGLGGYFYLPTDSDVVENLPYVKTAFKKKKPLRLYCNDFFKEDGGIERAWWWCSPKPPKLPERLE